MVFSLEPKLCHHVRLVRDVRRCAATYRRLASIFLNRGLVKEVEYGSLFILDRCPTGLTISPSAPRTRHRTAPSCRSSRASAGPPAGGSAIAGAVGISQQINRDAQHRGWVVTVTNASIEGHIVLLFFTVGELHVKDHGMRNYSAKNNPAPIVRAGLRFVSFIHPTKAG